MPLKPDEIKRRIAAARLLRDISQRDLNRMASEDGFGAEEMGRVERGELEFRPGKHLEALCRYLNVPRWWFTAETLEFGGVDGPPSTDEVASLLAQQNALLREQSGLLEAIKREVAEAREVKDETDELRRLTREMIEGRTGDRPAAAPVPPPRSGAET